MVSPENMYASKIIWTEDVLFMYLGMYIMYVFHIVYMIYCIIYVYVVIALNEKKVMNLKKTKKWQRRGFRGRKEKEK